MQLPEFLVAVEGEVDVGGLQVRPAVPLAVENAVVCLVDVETVVGPELHYGGVHEGVRCRGQKHRVDALERFVRLHDFVMEGLAQMLEAVDRFCAFEFQHVAYEFVRKPDGAVFHVGELLAVLVFSEGHVGTREHIERVSVHDHVLHLDAVFLPQFIVGH